MDGKGVSLMNIPARAAGIAPGSTLATARSIVADLKHFNRDIAEERRRLRLLAEAAYRYTPRVGMPAADCLVLDAGASLKLFGGAEALAANLHALLRRLGHAARIAAARTPAAAMALARAGIPNVVDADDSFDALRAAPLECAGAEIEGRDIERLANMGIFQFGQLLDLPRDELGEAFRTGASEVPGAPRRRRPGPGAPHRSEGEVFFVPAPARIDLGQGGAALPHAPPGLGTRHLAARETTRRPQPDVALRTTGRRRGTTNAGASADANSRRNSPTPGSTPRASWP